jgi:hypothetical protein
MYPDVFRNFGQQKGKVAPFASLERLQELYSVWRGNAKPSADGQQETACITEALFYIAKQTVSLTSITDKPDIKADYFMLDPDCLATAALPPECVKVAYCIMQAQRGTTECDTSYLSTLILMLVLQYYLRESTEEAPQHPVDLLEHYIPKEDSPEAELNVGLTPEERSDIVEMAQQVHLAVVEHWELPEPPPHTIYPFALRYVLRLMQHIYNTVLMCKLPAWIDQDDHFRAAYLWQDARSELSRTCYDHTPIIALPKPLPELPAEVRKGKGARLNWLAESVTQGKQREALCRKVLADQDAELLWAHGRSKKYGRLRELQQVVASKEGQRARKALLEHMRLARKELKLQRATAHQRMLLLRELEPEVAAAGGKLARLHRRLRQLEEQLEKAAADPEAIKGRAIALQEHREALLQRAAQHAEELAGEDEEQANGQEDAAGAGQESGEDAEPGTSSKEQHGSEEDEGSFGEEPHSEEESADQEGTPEDQARAGGGQSLADIMAAGVATQRRRLPTGGIRELVAIFDTAQQEMQEDMKVRLQEQQQECPGEEVGDTEASPPAHQEQQRRQPLRSVVEWVAQGTAAAGRRGERAREEQSEEEPPAGHGRGRERRSTDSAEAPAEDALLASCAPATRGLRPRQLDDSFAQEAGPTRGATPLQDNPAGAAREPAHVGLLTTSMVEDAYDGSISALAALDLDDWRQCVVGEHMKKLAKEAKQELKRLRWQAELGFAGNASKFHRLHASMPKRLSYNEEYKYLRKFARTCKALYNHARMADCPTADDDLPRALPAALRPFAAADAECTWKTVCKATWDALQDAQGTIEGEAYETKKDIRRYNVLHPTHPDVDAAKQGSNAHKQAAGGGGQHKSSKVLAGKRNRDSYAGDSAAGGHGGGRRLVFRDEGGPAHKRPVLYSRRDARAWFDTWQPPRPGTRVPPDVWNKLKAADVQFCYHCYGQGHEQYQCPLKGQGGGSGRDEAGGRRVSYGTGGRRNGRGGRGSRSGGEPAGKSEGKPREGSSAGGQDRMPYDVKDRHGK